MATLIGPTWATARAKSSSLPFFMFFQLARVAPTFVALYKQEPLLATYGYDSCVSMPLLSRMYLKARFITPPRHPLLPSLFEQSTRFCSLRDTSCLVLLKCAPSKLYLKARFI